MAKVIGKLACPNGKYINDAGEEKTRWSIHGVILQTDNGMRVKLESLPLTNADGGIWFSVFEDDNQQASRGAQSNARSQGFRDKPAPNQNPDDGGQPDIPF